MNLLWSSWHPANYLTACILPPEALSGMLMEMAICKYVLLHCFALRYASDLPFFRLERHFTDVLVQLL